MADNNFGRKLRITSFGESHGALVGIIIDGFPAGITIKTEFIQTELDKRKPGQSKITTSRKEADKVEILSGIFNERSTGAPICMIIKNKDVDSSKYEKYKNILRPSHVDFSSIKRYDGFADYRGSGRFSGRITAGFVMAGALAKHALKKMNINIFAYTKAIGEISDERKYEEKSFENLRTQRENSIVRCLDPEKSNEMVALIEKVQEEEDSIGGIVKCIIKNFPAGIGGPVFYSLESTLSHGVFSIPAIKGIEFGVGFEAATMKGSEHNDPWIIENERIQTSKNDAGGIIGGISTGMPIIFQIAVKPTASIGKTQHTVNISDMKETQLKLEGRHDPCIVPRIIIVLEAITAIVLLDHILYQGEFKLEGKNN
ncbi:MAG: chorismate synthase [Promethearchaeota archaeon]|nr:MAG: chorismate synthase [Candidatus Lokiarchaeota archaeon]